MPPSSEEKDEQVLDVLGSEDVNESGNQEESAPDDVPLEGIRRLRNLIQRGSQRGLEQLLDERAEELLLRREYGGGTSPLLHAASLGKMSIVSTLLTCLRNLQRGGTERSLHDQLVKRDGEGRSVLHLAASSGSKETFITVLDAFRQERVHGGKDDHVKNPSSARDDVRTTSSISSPFHSTRDVFAPEVEREEMQDILLKGADAGSTVLMAAASSGSKSIFHAAVTATEEVLTSQQVRQALVACIERKVLKLYTTTGSRPQ